MFSDKPVKFFVTSPAAELTSRRASFYSSSFSSWPFATPFCTAKETPRIPATTAAEIPAITQPLGPLAASSAISVPAVVTLEAYTFASAATSCSAALSSKAAPATLAAAFLPIQATTLENGPINCNKPGAIAMVADKNSSQLNLPSSSADVKEATPLVIIFMPVATEVKELKTPAKP
jgi:hypothetical protein